MLVRSVLPATGAFDVRFNLALTLDHGSSANPGHERKKKSYRWEIGRSESGVCEKGFSVGLPFFDKYTTQLRTYRSMCVKHCAFGFFF